MRRLGDTGTLGPGEVTIAAAATTNLGTLKARDVLISGTGITITSFGTSPNRDYRLRFNGAVTLTHNAASLVLPMNGQNLTTAAGDVAVVESDSSGNWRVTSFFQANGFSVVPAGTLAAPSYTFGDFPGTGLSMSGPNQISLSTAGAERMRFTAGGAISMNGSGVGAAFTILTTAGTGAATLALSSIGAAQGERSNLGFYATFTGQTDNVPRKAADVLAGFVGIWGGEYLGLCVGNGASAANDSQAVCTERVRVTAAALAPSTDNVMTLGASGKRWSQMFAATTTINTSDAREKTAVSALTANELAAATALAKEIGTFRFLDAVARKGAGARKHAGLTVQRAIAIMQANKLDPFAYGFICHDSWPADPTTAAGDRYGFRTDELMLFLARGFDARLTTLENKALSIKL